MILLLDFFLKSTEMRHFKKVTFVFKAEIIIVETITLHFYHIALVSPCFTFLKSSMNTFLHISSFTE